MSIYLLELGGKRTCTRVRMLPHNRLSFLCFHRPRVPVRAWRAAASQGSLDGRHAQGLAWIMQRRKIGRLAYIRYEGM